MDARRAIKTESGDDAVAIYHVVYKHEGFEDSARALFKLVQEAQKLRPGKKRKMFLDIEGHRNKKGAFDFDMVELQTNFLLNFLGRFLSEIHAPLASATNPERQDDEIPPMLIFQRAE